MPGPFWCLRGGGDRRCRGGDLLCGPLLDRVG
jgi:hypothetical protein